jgi:hypothetical protein
LTVGSRLVRLDRMLWRHGWLVVALVSAVLASFHWWLANVFWPQQDIVLPAFDDPDDATRLGRQTAAGLLARIFGTIAFIAAVPYCAKQLGLARSLAPAVGRVLRWAMASVLLVLAAYFAVLVLPGLVSGEALFECLPSEERCVPSERIAVNVAYLGMVLAFAAAPFALVPPRKDPVAPPKDASPITSSR